MLGIFHVTLIDLVAARGGAPAVACMLEAAGLAADTRFRIDTRYAHPDAERLLDAAATALGVDDQSLHRAHAAHIGAYALQVFPTFFELAADSLTFLRRQPRLAELLVAGTHDPETGQAPPERPGPLVLETTGSHGLRVRWSAGPGLQSLYFELLRWVVRHYRDVADVRMQRVGGDAGTVAVYDLHWISYANHAGEARRPERFDTPDSAPPPVR